MHIQPDECRAVQDQLRHQVARGAVFKWMHEQPITFQPTYKFDKHYPDLLGYDSSEKRRVPAWCDRIFYRGSELTRRTEEGAIPQVRFSVICCSLCHRHHTVRGSSSFTVTARHALCGPLLLVQSGVSCRPTDWRLED